VVCERVKPTYKETELRTGIEKIIRKTKSTYSALLSLPKGNALQTGRSPARFPIVSQEFFIDTVALWSTQDLTEMSTRDISWGVKAAGA